MVLFTNMKMALQNKTSESNINGIIDSLKVINNIKNIFYNKEKKNFN